MLEVNIAAEAETALTGGVGNSGGAYVNHDGTRLDHILGHETGLTEGGDDDVGLGAYFIEIFRAAVADGHRAVARLTLLHKQSGNRLAHDVAAAYHNAMTTRGGYLITAKKLDYTGGSGALEAVETYAELAYVDRMETVDVFLRVYGFDNLLLVDMTGKGELDNETVDFGVFVELIDFREELLFGDVILKPYES